MALGVKSRVRLRQLAHQRAFEVFYGDAEAMAFQDTMMTAGAQVDTSHDAFQFSDLIRVAGERASMILAVATTIVALTLLGLLLWPTSYTASAVVLLDPRNNAILQNSSVLTAQPTDPASVQNQIQILTSRDIAARVITDLKLNTDPEFASPALLSNIPPSTDDIIDTFEKHLTVTTVGLSTTFTIAFWSKDPQKAARIANAIANAYLQDEVSVENDASRGTTGWLLDRIQILARQVQQAESAVQQYKAMNNLTDIGDGTSLVDQQLLGVNTALVAAKSDLAEKQANANHINSMLSGGQVGDVSQVVASPLMIQLRTQEADVLQKEAQLGVRYGARNPKMIDIESQKQNLEEKIAQEAARIGGSVANDVSVSRANVGSLQYSLNQLQNKETSQGLARVQLKALEANATSTRTMYEAFVTRLRETQGDIQMPDARILSQAAIPTKPSSPKTLLIAGASIPAALLIGLLVALFAERAGAATHYHPLPARAASFAKQAKPALKTATDTLRGARVLGQIPDYADLRAADLMIERPQDAYARSVEALLTQIVPNRRGSGNVIALAAPDQSDGKTALATALARAATQRGYRTIVVDGDFQGPKAALAMGLPLKRSGLQDVLSGTAPLSQNLTRDPRSTAYLLSPASVPITSAAFLKEVPRLLAYLRKSFDLVIVDCPQPAQANAARYFLPLSDAALLLIHWQTTPRSKVTQALDALSALRVPSIGVVFAR